MGIGQSDPTALPAEFEPKSRVVKVLEFIGGSAILLAAFELGLVVATFAAWVGWNTAQAVWRFLEAAVR